MRNLRDTRSRLQKLADMATHPTANPHEAASARAEIARLKATGHVEAPPPLSWLDVAHSPDLDTFARRYAEMDRRERATPKIRNCWICGMRLAPSFGLSFPPTRCPLHAHTKTSGDDGYNEWARALKIGEAVLVHEGRPKGAFEVPPRLTIVRQTATQHVMSDGTRYRRAGDYPGGKVGEDGRCGWRTYLIAVDGEA